MDVPDGSPHYMYKIMKECWCTDANLRPNFAHIERRLRDILVL